MNMINDNAALRKDLSHVTCFTDADGCLFDSLPYCNIILDQLFLGKLTDKHYKEYYKDFGDAYEIIPGSPWKNILRDLTDYHTLRLPEARNADDYAELYKRSMAYVACDIEPGNPIDKTTEEMLDILVERFTLEIAKKFKTLKYADFALDPVIRFCRMFKDAGGHLIIHSGTNEKILLAMLDAAGIRDMFDDYLCSDMMRDADPAKMGKWGYKTELLKRLLAKHPLSSEHAFVLGDTKGDGYGAYEVGLPFVLTWRGYPADPTRLIGSDGEALTPNFVFDVRNETNASATDDEINARCKELLEYAGIVAEGSQKAPAVSR